MRYSLEQDAKMMNRVLRYSSGDALIPGLVIIVLSGTLLTQYNPVLAVATLGIVCTFILFYVAYLMFYPEYMRKNYGDNEGRVFWTYDITRKDITISIAEKAKLTYEKEAVRFCKPYKHGVYFKHKRSTFILFIPDGREREVYKRLKNYGWLNKKRSAYRELLFLLFWTLLVVTAAIVTIAGK